MRSLQPKLPIDSEPRAQAGSPDSKTSTKIQWNEQTILDAKHLSKLIPYGKYAEISLEQLIDTDPAYVCWMQENTEMLHVPIRWYHICKRYS